MLKEPFFLLTERTALLRLLPHILTNNQTVALAVSGGPDSMAMAWLAKEQFGIEHLHAFIVDHALRPESGQEAQTVKMRLTAMGIKTNILRWEHDQITSRIHVIARQARYDLLIAACKTHNIKTLLLAHHKNDQAETILMRLAKGSGLRGLSGMKEAIERDGVTLRRPLLNTTKDKLIALCQTHQIPVVTDPSNKSDNYARGRLRRVHDALESEGFTEDRMIDLAARASDATDAITHYAHAFLRTHASPTFGGAVQINRSAFKMLPRAIALEVLSSILQTIHNSPYAPRRAQLLEILGREDTASLQGCLIQKSEKHILILREPSAITDQKPIAPQETILWDGRWQVTYKDTKTGLEIRALGTQKHAVLQEIAPSILTKVPQGRVRASLPALWERNNLHSIPSFCCDYGMLFK